MMRKILLALCIILAGGSAAAKDGTNWKSISQMGADMVGAATQGVFKTVSETSKSLLRSECALPVVQQDYDKADTLVECLKQPALAGLKEAARAMEQKQGSIDEGGRNVTNLINDTMDGLGIQELKFCTQEERLRYEKGESEKFPMRHGNQRRWRRPFRQLHVNRARSMFRPSEKPFRRPEH